MFPYWVYNLLVIFTVYNLAASYIFFRILLQDNMPQQRQASVGLPYKDHPLYRLRVASVFTAIIGFLLNFIAIIALIDYDSYQIPPFVFSLIFLFVSFIFVLHDLITYAVAKATALVSRSDLPTVNVPPATDHVTAAATAGGHSEPPIPVRPAEDKPSWPSKRLIIFDLILAVIFQFLFWIEFGTIVSSWHRYYSSGTETFEAYANLANFVASLLHAVAFWKEVIARKKQAWQRSLEPVPCSNCGHSESVAAGPTAAVMTVPDALRHTEDERRPGASALFETFRQGKPTWNKSSTGDRDIENEAADAEAPLLVTPDGSTTEVAGPSGYGTLDQSVGSVPESVVKKKGKGKKRLVEVDSE